MATTVIGTCGAARLLGISSQLMHYYGDTGRIKTLRLKPTQVYRVADVLEYKQRRDACPVLSKKKMGRPNKLDKIMSEVLA
jgi:hypothetical protein